MQSHTFASPWAHLKTLVWGSVVLTAAAAATAAQDAGQSASPAQTQVQTPSNSKPASPAQASKPVLTVQTVAAQSQMWVRSLPASGSLAAWQEAIVGAEAQGLQITEVLAQVGDVVRKGQVLVRLQTLTVQAELAQAQASLAEAQALASEAKAQAERSRQLREQNFISAAQLSQALATEASALARVEAARALLQVQTQRLAQTEVRAPDHGVVSARAATLGAVVTPGMELFRLIRQGRLEWRAEVTAAELGALRVGAPAKLTAASGQVLQGRVRAIAPALDVQTRNALVYVELQGELGSARAGMFARGDVALGEALATTLPQSAVVVRDGFSYVFSVGPHAKVSQHKVQTGRTQGERVEVVSGLPPGARFVLSGGAFLNHGDTVRVAAAPESAAPAQATPAQATPAQATPAKTAAAKPASAADQPRTAP